MSTQTTSINPPKLTDWEISRLARFFEILIRIEQRAKKQMDDLRTDKTLKRAYNNKQSK